MSYGSFERDTTSLRIQHSRTAFSRLRSWLTSAGIAFRTRYRLWQSCVFSILSYGILAVGVDGHCMHTLQKELYRQLRYLCKDHAYVTHHTHQQALATRRCPQPLELLHSLSTQTHRTQMMRLHAAAEHDIIHTIDWTPLTCAIQLFATERLTGPAIPVASFEAEVITKRRLTCHLCSFTTDTPPNLKRHMTSVHGHRLVLAHTFNHSMHALNGVPQCTRCKQKFSTWKSLQHHIDLHCCQAHLAFQSRPPMALTGRAAPYLSERDLLNLRSTSWGRRYLSLVDRQAWTELATDQEACQALRSTCQLCGAWVGRINEMNRHYRDHHSQVLPGVFAKASQLEKEMRDGAPCRMCAKEFETTHV